MLMYTWRKCVSAGCMLIFCFKSSFNFCSHLCCTTFLAVCCQFAFDTQSRKETLGVAVLWRKLFVVRVLYVVWEDLHINTAEAVNEDGLRQACQNIWVYLGERGCLSHRGVKLVPLILSRPLLWLANVNCFILQATEVWQSALQDAAVATDSEGD